MTHQTNLTSYRSRWQALWQRLGATTDPGPAFAALVECYREPQRAYHNLDHIIDCLTQFDPVREQIGRPDEVELAIWLHDVIYDPHAADNETQSANWGANILRQGQVSEAVISRVSTLIEATQHTDLPEDPDAQYLVDIDLSILGRPPEIFDRYQTNIRREYDWVPDNVFRATRAQILASFLNRSIIYHTPYFQQQYEGQARHNLKRAIEALSD